MGTEEDKLHDRMRQGRDRRGEKRREERGGGTEGQALARPGGGE